MAYHVFLIAIGGAVGALSRYFSVVTIHYFIPKSYPYGTLFVNSVGSLLIGFCMGLMFEKWAVASDPLRFLVIIGFLGSYTTFSTYSWELYQLFHQGFWGRALLHFGLNNIITLMMVILGLNISKIFQ